MDEEFIEEEAPFEEEDEETKLEDDELDGSEEGFIKGYEDRAVKEKKPAVDEDEQLTD